MSAPVSWDDQRTFLAVLEAGSLSAAARRLGVTQPTVRARIEALERALGTALFTRSARGLAPTAQARELAAPARAMAHASEAFLRAASAPADDAVGTAATGAVRIGVSELVGVEVLPPMLRTLKAEHPGLVPEVVLDDAPADVLEQEVDVAVRMTTPVQGALVARKAGTVEIGFFASAAYLDARGVPTHPDELGVHDIVGPDRARRDLALAAALHPSLARERFAVRTDSHPAQLALARAGLGIAAVQVPLGDADPALVRVLPDAVLGSLETWVVMHEDLRAVARVRAAFDHLVAGFARYLEPPAGGPVGATRTG